MNLMCRPELLENLKGNEKVKIIANAEIQELKGSEYLDYAVVKVNDEIKEYPVQYAFMYLGTKIPWNFTESLHSLMKRDILLQMSL